MIGKILWSGMIGARNESPQAVASPDRHRQCGRDPHVPVILRAHLGDASQEAVRHVKRLARVRVQQRHQLRKRVRHVGNRTQPGFDENIPRRFGNVFGWVMQA